MICEIKGAFHRPPAGFVLRVLPLHTRLWLRADVNNQFDPNAIAILLNPTDLVNEVNQNPSFAQDLERAVHKDFSLDEFLNQPNLFQVGFVPKEIAAELKAQGWNDNTSVEGKFLINSANKPAVRFSGGN